MNDEFRMEQRTVNQAGESLGRYTAENLWLDVCGTAYNIDRCHQYVCYRSIYLCNPDSGVELPSAGG